MNHFHDEDFGRQQVCFSTELALPQQRFEENTPSSGTKNWFRSTLLGQMKGLERGELCIHESRRPLQYLGTSSSSEDLQAHIVVGDPCFYRKVLFGGTIGAAESYMNGDWVSDNLTDVTRIIIRNLRKMTLLEKSAAWLKNRLYWIQHVFRRNSIAGSRKNIHAHYDLGNEFYQLFLDPTMNYSSGIFAAANENSPDRCTMLRFEK
jgi:cyclopropane-fatty-acyl-phospholipid synthase